MRVLSFFSFVLLSVGCSLQLIAAANCPCESQSLCDLISDTTRKEIFVFSLRNSPSSWVKFDWKKVTTVVTVGYVSQQLMCLAHKNGARIINIANYPRANLTSTSDRTKWIADQLQLIKSNFYDGINIDFEEPILQNETTIREGYTALVRGAYQAFKQAHASYQVTVDVAWSPDCIDLRCYDIMGLAANTDFLFVMAYDEQSQIFGPCTARANSDFNKTFQGLQAYLKLGVRPYQLVLGVPWYGYNYECLTLSRMDVCTIKKVPFRGVACSDAAGSQIDYRNIVVVLNTSSSGRKWDSDAQSPYFNYQDASTGRTHQVRYDDPESLTVKARLAVQLGLRGMGTWNVDAIDYSDTPYAAQERKMMFGAFPSYPRR